jgi:DNA-binding NtrC family response regulator
MRGNPHVRCGGGPGEKEHSYLACGLPYRGELCIANLHLTPDPAAREGYDLAQRWRAQEPTLPIILISGDPSLQALPEVQAGAMRFVAKPQVLDAVLQAVREVLGR